MGLSARRSTTSAWDCSEGFKGECTSLGAFMLLLPRFFHRDRDGLSVGDLNEITHGHAIEVARVACLDRRRPTCRTPAR